MPNCRTQVLKAISQFYEPTIVKVRREELAFGELAPTSQGQRWVTRAYSP